MLAVHCSLSAFVYFIGTVTCQFWGAPRPPGPAVALQGSLAGLGDGNDTGSPCPGHGEGCWCHDRNKHVIAVLVLRMEISVLQIQNGKPKVNWEVKIS